MQPCHLMAVSLAQTKLGSYLSRLDECLKHRCLPELMQTAWPQQKSVSNFSAFKCWLYTIQWACRATKKPGPSCRCLHKVATQQILEDFCRSAEAS